MPKEQDVRGEKFKGEYRETTHRVNLAVFRQTVKAMNMLPETKFDITVLPSKQSSNLADITITGLSDGYDRDFFDHNKGVFFIVFHTLDLGNRLLEFEVGSADTAAVLNAVMAGKNTVTIIDEIRQSVSEQVDNHFIWFRALEKIKAA